MDIYFIFAMFQVSPIQINLDDLDALIADLSPEEVEELSRADPDVSRYTVGFNDSNLVANTVKTGCKEAFCTANRSPILYLRTYSMLPIIFYTFWRCPTYIKNI